MAIDVQARFHKALREAFGCDPTQVHEGTALYDLGDASAVDDFYDELEFEFENDLTDAQKANFRRVGEALAWAQEQGARLAAEEAEEEQENQKEFYSEFAWQDKISKFQRLFLKASSALGGIIFFVCLNLSIRKKGGPLMQGMAGMGMFIAVQMFWGVKKCFNFLEKNNSSLLKMGYQRLFWFIVIAAYLLDMVGIGLLLSFFGLPT